MTHGNLKLTFARPDNNSGINPVSIPQLTLVRRWTRNHEKNPCCINHTWTSSLELLKASAAMLTFPYQWHGCYACERTALQPQAMLTGKTAPGTNGDACVNHNCRAASRERGSKAHVQVSPIPLGDIQWKKRWKELQASIYSSAIGSSQWSVSSRTEMMHLGETDPKIDIHDSEYPSTVELSHICAFRKLSFEPLRINKTSMKTLCK